MSVKKALALAVIASSVSLISTQPAWSNQWTDIFKSILIPQTGIATNDSISIRDSQITNRIIDAINANKLSPSDSQSLKVQLDRVKSMEANYRANHSDNQLDAIETASVNAELNKVEISLNQMLGLSSNYGINNNNYGSNNSGYNNYNSGTSYGASVTTNVDNFDGALADVKQRISKNLSTGRLTVDEAKPLVNQYDRIVSDRNSAKADGSISPDEANRLNQQIEDIKRSIASNTHDSQAWPGIDGQQEAQAKRIEDGIATGRINRSEYEQLKAESNRIANQESSFRANGLQLNEALSLATSLRSLDQRITVSLNNAASTNNSGTGSGFGGGYGGGRDNWSQSNNGSDFDLRQTHVMRKIDESAANGRLSPAEATDLRADYSRLEQLEASYRADGRLTPNELDVLQKGLDSIQAELKDKSSTISVTVQYPEIDRKQADLKNRIDDAVNRSRISRADGLKLTNNLSWIASAEAAFRQSGGTLDRSEADRIIADLDRLSAKIDRSMSNPVQDLITRKLDLQKKIDDNRLSGKLSPGMARNLRRDLDRISYTLPLTASAATTMRPDEITRMTSDMDRLSVQITSGVSYGGGNGNGYRGGRDWNQR